MKKFMIFFAVILLFACAFFASCSSNDNDNDDDNLGDNEWNDEWDIKQYQSVEDGYTLFYLEQGENFIGYYGGWVFVWSNDDESPYASSYPAPTTEPSPPPSSVYRMRPDGSEKQKLPDLAKFYGGVYLDQWLYYTDGSTLFKIRLDGLEKTELAESVYDFVIRGEWIYYRDNVSLLLSRIKTDGTSRTNLSGYCLSFIVESGYIFMIEEPGYTNLYKITRLNLDGTDKKDLTDETHKHISLAFTKNDYLYYTENNFRPITDKTQGERLYRIRFDGSDFGIALQLESYCELGYISFKGDSFYFERIYLDGDNYMDGSNYISEICSLKIDESEYTPLSPPFRGAILLLLDNSILYASVNEGEMKIICQYFSGDDDVLLREFENPELCDGFFIHENKLYIAVTSAQIPSI